jgi:hypothetical protein
MWQVIGRFHSYFFALVKTLIRNQIHRWPRNRRNGIANALSKPMWKWMECGTRWHLRDAALCYCAARAAAQNFRLSREQLCHV